MADDTSKYHYFFIHNVMGDFFHTSLDFFGPYLYERFKYKVVSTYDKAVEYLSKKEQYDRETDLPLLPAIVLDPNGEFGTADSNAGGKQLWRYPNLAGKFATNYLFDPIYQDEDVKIGVGFTRIKGTFNLIMLTNSFYEYTDLRIYMIQQLGDLNRYIYPEWVTTFIILPQEFINFEYTNPDTGISRRLNWDSVGAYQKLIKTTNLTEYVCPVEIRPIYKMTSMNDGSTKYGGTDKLADWRLTLEIEYELEIPSFLILTTDFLITSVKSNFQVTSASTYSENSMYYNLMSTMTPPQQHDFLKYIVDKHGETFLISDVRQDLIKDDNVKRIVPKESIQAFFGINPEKKTPEQLAFEPHGTEINQTKEWTTGLDETSSGDIDLDPDKVIKTCEKRELVFNTRYAHIVTQQEADSTTTIEIQIPERVTKERLVLIGKSGPFLYGEHYILNDIGNIITIYKTTVSLRKNDLIELYIYVYE